MIRFIPLSVLVGVIAACQTPDAMVGQISAGDETASTAGMHADSGSGFESGSGSTSTSSHGITDGDPGTSSGESSAADSGLLLDVGAHDTETGDKICPPHATLINLLAGANMGPGYSILTFDPILVEYEEIAMVPCVADDAIFFGIAVDRQGRITLLIHQAGVLFEGYQAMKMVRFYPGDLECEEIFYGAIENATANDALFSGDLSFVSLPDDPTEERLFVHSSESGRYLFTPGVDSGLLFRFNDSAKAPDFEFLAANEYNSVALAGTGDGRLFGIGGDALNQGGRILEFDQETGAILQTTTLPELDLGTYAGSLALAFYGGDLYTFGVNPSDVSDELLEIITRYDLDGNDDESLLVVSNAPPPQWIMAAASPTCIPTEPPG